MARETCAAAELFASGASGDHTGVFPRAWRVAHLRACGEATSASLCSPASLYARAATLRADIADADAATIGTDDPTNEEAVRVVERAGEWRARETEAWRRAALATASPRVARALAAAMAGDETRPNGPSSPPSKRDANGGTANTRMKTFWTTRMTTTNSATRRRTT